MTYNEKFKVNLSARQLDAYEGVRFLVSGGRAQGRTFLLCMAFIEHAVHYRGEWIKLFDHYGHMNKGYMFDMIEGIFKNSVFNESMKLIIKHEGTIMVRYKTQEELRADEANGANND